MQPSQWLDKYRQPLAKYLKFTSLVLYGDDQHAAPIDPFGIDFPGRLSNYAFIDRAGVIMDDLISPNSRSQIILGRSGVGKSVVPPVPAASLIK